MHEAMHEVNVRLPIPDELWAEIAELAEKKSSRPGELAEFLVMVGLYHHLRSSLCIRRKRSCSSSQQDGIW